MSVLGVILDKTCPEEMLEMSLHKVNIFTYVWLTQGMLDNPLMLISADL